MSRVLALGPGEPAERIDRALARLLDLPRNQVQRLLRDGHVMVGGRPAKPSQSVGPGEAIAVDLPAPPQEQMTAETGELRILHEDEDLVVLDKPPGLSVHPGAGRREGTLAHRLLGRWPEMAGVGGPGRPGIVHRLDLGTSGAIVVARSARAYRALSQAFAGREVTKTYLAIAWGRPAPAAGTIELPIGRHPTHRTQMAVRPGGRPAHTAYRTLTTGVSGGASGGVSLLEVALGTGRTHQIRVHLRAIRNPLIGDPVYGEARWRTAAPAARAALRDFPRPALHAWRLAFTHPATGERLEVEAPVPADLRELWTTATASPWPQI